MKIPVWFRSSFLLLLPVFFVFHGYVGNYPFVRFTDCLSLTGIYCGTAAGLFGLFFLFLKHPLKAALAATFCMAFFLFFGYLHDPLRKHGIFLHRYSILLPLFLILTVLLMVWLRSKAPFNRLGLFLTVLFLVYIAADGIALVWKGSGKQSQGIAASSIFEAPQSGCDTCPRPDIYLLIFDEYSASRTLRNIYHYDNSGLDSFLVRAGFHIQAESRANYFVTPFSMCSMLNLSYLKGIAHPEALQPDDYTNLFEPIRKNAAVNFLLSRGYEVVNNSPFDLPGHPAHLLQTYIATRTRLITSRTLFDYFVRDVGAWATDRLGTVGLVFANKITTIEKTNETAIQNTVSECARRSVRPRFVFMHVFLPHAPYIFDSARHRRSQEEIAGASGPANYLGYLPYTNDKAREVITAIKQNTGGKAVILFMSDHGFRCFDPQVDPASFFYNQNAVYFPNGDYSGFYDEITNVNQFRVVFTKLFHLNLPLLKDSTVFLWDRK